MSSALYIVLEKPIPNFDHAVNGKSLAKAAEWLDELAERAGATPLMQFFSASPEEFREFLGSHDSGGGESVPEFPSEQWFSAEQGLETVQRLTEALDAIENREKILEDLAGFRRVLEAAKSANVRWHLAVDY